MKKIEHTPEPWSVDRTDDYGSYRIHEAAKEQNQWVDEGYDLSEEEGERRGAIAEQHDEGNLLLIEVAPQLLKLVRSIWESRYTDGGEDIGVPANGYTVRLNAEQCDIIRQIITEEEVTAENAILNDQEFAPGEKVLLVHEGVGFYPDTPCTIIEKMVDKPMTCHVCGNLWPGYGDPDHWKKNPSYHLQFEGGGKGIYPVGRIKKVEG